MTNGEQGADVVISKQTREQIGERSDADDGHRPPEPVNDAVADAPQGSENILLYLRAQLIRHDPTQCPPLGDALARPAG